MPWTFAHPAAVIPLRRYCPHPLNFPALVIGSMTPDLGYHAQAMHLAAYAHSLAGSLLVCLPTGLLLLALLCLLRKPLWFLLPRPHRDAFAPAAAADPALSPGAVLWAAASILLGAWTHIVWDAATHNNGWFVVRSSFLQGAAFQVGGIDFHVYHVLQHLSTCVGVAVMVAAYWHWLKGATPAVGQAQPEERWRYRLLAVFAIAAILVGGALAAMAAGRHEGFLAFRVFAVRGAVDGMSVFIAFYVVGAVLCYRARPVGFKQ